MFWNTSFTCGVMMTSLLISPSDISPPSDSSSPGSEKRWRAVLGGEMVLLHDD